MELTRIVRMAFQPDKTDDFLKLFRDTYSRIRFFEGCSFLELHKDHSEEGVYYTVSRWQSADALENYRQSELFRQTWSITRTYFAGKPMAFSLENVVGNRINP